MRRKVKRREGRNWKEGKEEGRKEWEGCLRGCMKRMGRMVKRREGSSVKGG